MPTIIDVTGIQNALIGTTDISDIGEGTLTSGLDKHNENFANEETSPTTAAHAIGEYIVWKGTLYRVKTAISAGATLEVGRNIVKRTVAGVSEDLAGSIATVETSPATANHSVGEYIVYNGQLYKVTTAITAGTTLTGKISATSVGDEINEAKKTEMTQILSQNAIPTSYTEYSCDWEAYSILVLCFRQYSNIRVSVIVPKEYFNSTSDGTRPQLFDPQNTSRYIYICKGSNTNTVKMLASTEGASSAYGITIYGIK